MELSIITMHSPDAFILIYCCNVCSSLEEHNPPRIILSALCNLNDKAYSLLQLESDNNSSSVKQHRVELYFHRLTVSK